MKKLYTLLVIVFLACTASIAQMQELVVRTLHAGELPAGEVHQFPNAVQTKYAEIDFGLLNEKGVFSLSLFDNQKIQFRFEKLFSYTVGSSSWYGKSTDGSGDVIFSFYLGQSSGTIVDDFNKKYIMQQIGGSTIYAITLVNVESMNESNGASTDYILPDERNKKSRANPDVCAVGTTCPASTIDLMVLGNAQAITDAGGTVPAFVTSATTATTQMNTAYANSGGTGLTFNLIHCNATAFVATADINADLTNFAADAGIQALRNTYYADLVSFWVGGAYDCGLGYLNTNPTNYSSNSAYNVCSYSCATTNLTFAHECGHNMGLRHDYFVDGGVTPCSHHHGYTNQVVIPSGLPATGRWRTIMAYNNECSANGFNCTRLARWANPSSNYLGDPTGIAIGQPQPANEIYGFERFKCVVAGFRNNPLPLDLLSFEGKHVDNRCKLLWTTTNENNFKGFEVEMKNSFQDDFKKLAFVESRGNANGVSTYNLLSDVLMPGQYYFRLKLLDLDNQYKYSEVIQVSISGNEFQSSIFPNPSKGQFSIQLYNPKSQALKISLSDMLGKEIATLLNENCGIGSKELKCHTSGLAKGIYICTISGKDEKYISKLVIE